MTAFLLYLASLNWIYLDDGNIQGWFASAQSRPVYSVYYDRTQHAVAIIHWSGHPREDIPLAWIVDRDGFRIQEQHLRPPPPDPNPLTEVQQ